MSWKLLDRIILLFLIFVGLSYAINVNDTASRYISSNTLGPTYFPNILTGLLIVLCIIAFVQGKNKENTKVVIPNFKYMLFTISLTVLFILCWQKVGYFYVNIFVFITILLTVFRKEKGIKHSLAVGAFTALLTTGMLYLLFGIVLAISL